MPEAPNLTTAKLAEHKAREERLARALRENLRRRKQQAREQAERIGAGSSGPREEPPA